MHPNSRLDIYYENVKKEMNLNFLSLMNDEMII